MGCLSLDWTGPSAGVGASLLLAWQPSAVSMVCRAVSSAQHPYTTLPVSTICFTLAMALPGFKPLGQTAGWGQGVQLVSGRVPHSCGRWRNSPQLNGHAVCLKRQQVCWQT